MTAPVFQRVGAFFAGQHAAQKALRRVVETFGREGIPFAVSGGMALAAHGLVRVTETLDFVTTPGGLPVLRSLLVRFGYASTRGDEVFVDAENGVTVRVEVLPDLGPEASVVLDGQRVLTLEMLIQLELASGLSAAHRMRDLADVQDLIRVKGLPRELAGRLDESVRAEYLRLWESVQGLDDGPA